MWKNICFFITILITNISEGKRDTDWQMIIKANNYIAMLNHLIWDT